MAYLRLSYYDGHLFPYFLPRLVELIPDFTREERKDVIAAVENVWAIHFPFGGAFDLANQLARFLYAMDEYARAITFCERSMAMYGEQADTINIMAICYQQLDQPERANQLLESLHV